MTVPDEATTFGLRYAAARLWLDALPPEEAIGIIECLAAAGLWRDEFFAVLDAPPVLREVAEPFVACLDALGVSIDGTAQALRWLVAHHVRNIVTGRTDPCHALVQLIEQDLREYYRSGTLTELFRGVADFQTLEDFHKDCDYFLMPYDDMWTSAQSRDAARAELGQRIITAARRWQEAAGA